MSNITKINRNRSARTSSIMTKSLIHLVLILGASSMILPFLWMFFMSFKTFREATAIPIVWLPSKFRIENYFDVLTRLSFGRYLLNTIYVTVVTTVVQLFFCSITAYGFSKFKFPGRDAMFFMFLCLLMIPAQMVVLPRYFMVIKLGWLNRYSALIVPHYVSIYGTFLLRQYFMSLPNELTESAKIDGCSYIRVYSHILVPLMANAFIALAIYTIVFNWNDLLWPIMVIDKKELRTLAVGIGTLRTDNVQENRHLQMTAGVIAMAPLIISFLVGQKYFIRSIALSGIKG